MLLQCVTIETGAGAQHALVVLLLVVLGVAGRDAGAVRGAAGEEKEDKEEGKVEHA